MTRVASRELSALQNTPNITFRKPTSHINNIYQYFVIGPCLSNHRFNGYDQTNAVSIMPETEYGVFVFVSDQSVNTHETRRHDREFRIR